VPTPEFGCHIQGESPSIPERCSAHIFFHQWLSADQEVLEAPDLKMTVTGVIKARFSLCRGHNLDVTRIFVLGDRSSCSNSTRELHLLRTVGVLCPATTPNGQGVKHRGLTIHLLKEKAF
jgi:hypothetical protein